MRGHISALGVGATLFAGLLLMTAPAGAANEAETADLLVKLLKTGRGVVSANQDLINDATKGYKGFTAESLESAVIPKYREQTKIDLSKSPSTQPEKLLHLLLQSGKEVVAEAQPVINKQGLGFKGFLPAVYARKTGEKFYQKTGIRLKLTGIDYRFPGNKPDEFESEVLKMFADPRHPKGQEYAKSTMVNGKPVLRLMSPEYAAATCLKCHGDPKGERDITGGRKEGWKEGDLAGAISLVLPIQ